MDQITMVREWSSEAFHAKVLELEESGWQARLDSYLVIPEMNSETGYILHVHSIEMFKSGEITEGAACLFGNASH